MRYIPQDLLNKIKKSEMTIYNDAEPRIEVDVARARNSVMDSSYWTREIIREEPGVEDIEVAARRFFKHHGRPDRLYEIYIENGTAKAGHREYPDLEKVGWQHDFDLGPGTDVAIAFDGVWKEYRGSWRFQTEESPWLFWVNDLGELYGQHWDDASTLIQLSTSVTKVSAIRGWNNENILGKDHGLVVGYIKNDGLAYYKNKCYQQNGDYIWESERQLTQVAGTIINLDLFLTIDYRLGIALQDSTNNIHWIITNRNWAGLSIGLEKIEVNSHFNMELKEVTYHNALSEESVNLSSEANIGNLLFGRTDNTAIATNVDDGTGDWGRVIEIELDHKVYNVPNVTIYDIDYEVYIPVGNVTVSDGNNIIATVQSEHEVGMNNILGDAQVEILGATNEAGYLFETISTIFTPTNLVPVDLPLPEVEEVWNE